jgi:uncharacterized ParB-like nuclease family protein
MHGKDLTLAKKPGLKKFLRKKPSFTVFKMHKVNRSLRLEDGIIVWICEHSSFRSECDKSGDVTYYKDGLGSYYALCKKHRYNEYDEVTEDEVLCYLITKM